MERPTRFIIRTFEHYKNSKDQSFVYKLYKDIIYLMIKNKYNMYNSGINNEGYYYWEFYDTNNKKIEKEIDKDGFIEFINNHKRDEEYFKKIKEETTPIIEKMFGKKNKNLL